MEIEIQDILHATGQTPFKDDNVILNLNRSRMRAVYYRPIQVDDGIQWIKTLPLPADPFSISYYFAKGFRAKPPEISKVPEIIPDKKSRGRPRKKSKKKEVTK